VPKQKLDRVPVLQRPVDKRTQNFERRGLVRVEVGIQEGTRATGSGSEQQVLADLVVSQRTVEIHRARVMEKMQVRSLAQLVRMVMQIQE